MKKAANKIDKYDGKYVEIQAIETTPEDGFVPESVIHPNDIDTVGKYHNSYSKTSTYATNDSRITRPIVYIMCGILFLHI